MVNVEKSGYMKYKDKSGNMTTMYPNTKIANVEGLEEWDKAMLLKNVAAAMPIKILWLSVCHGNDKFVATAFNSTVAAYSTDGITWTQTTMPAKAEWRGLHYANGKFVAVANGTIAAYSTDGINWTQTTMPVSADWKSVCYGNGKFVAVSYYNTVVVYSTDGITWTNAEYKVVDPANNNVTDNLKTALGTATMAEVNTAIQTAIQNTWEASY